MARNAPDDHGTVWSTAAVRIGATGLDLRGPGEPGSLDELLNARLGKWTVITSNLNIGQIAERLDVRISSRLMRKLPSRWPRP